MKKTLLTLGTVALLATPSLFAAQDSLQQHLRMEQKLQTQMQKRLKDGSGEEHQYKYQKQNQYKYQGTNPSRPNTGSMSGSMGGGGRH
jgi:outer membrane lipoprotein-sorting protein